MAVMSAQPAKTDDSLFIRACRGEATARPPLWMMRQAGRYLPEYRQIREKVSFLELCKTPHLAAEVTLQPIRRFGFDAAILFSDLLVPLEAMGLAVEFTEQGPRLPAPLRGPEDLARVQSFDPTKRTDFVLETIRLVKAAEFGEPFGSGEVGPGPAVGPRHPVAQDRRPCTQVRNLGQGGQHDLQLAAGPVPGPGAAGQDGEAEDTDR